MTMGAQVASPGQGGWRTAVQAGLVYALIVFTIAFAVGAIRVMLVVPRLGALVGVLLEAPIVLSVSWVVSLWCIRRLALGSEAPLRLAMGAVAFSALMVLEAGFALAVFGESLDGYLAKFATTPGAVGLAAQLGFAAIPRIQSVRSP